mmetsp:Transcript_50937/g.95301  ORF Transcript_50937/g.95301 Transcript_50937/m.95301 type:complete len:298 (-) Transcript_50937:6-899(-)
MTQLSPSAHIHASDVRQRLVWLPSCHEIWQSTCASLELLVVAQGRLCHGVELHLIQPGVCHRPRRGTDQVGAILVGPQLLAKHCQVGQEGVDDVLTAPAWSLAVSASLNCGIQTCLDALKLVSHQGVDDHVSQLPLVDCNSLLLAVNWTSCPTFSEVDPWHSLPPDPEGIPLKRLTHEVGQVLDAHRLPLEHRRRRHPSLSDRVPHVLRDPIQVRNCVVNGARHAPRVLRVGFEDPVRVGLGMPHTVIVGAHEPELGRRLLLKLGQPGDGVRLLISSEDRPTCHPERQNDGGDEEAW